jgi:hypothetical protein
MTAPMLHTQLIHTLLLPERKLGRILGTFQKQCSFGNRGLFDRKILSHSHLVFQGFIYIYIYLTAIGLTPGGSSTVHIYTQTTHRIQRTEHT